MDIKNQKSEPSERMKRFKEWLLQLAVRLIRISPHHIVKEIEESLQFVRNLFEFDNIALVEFSDDLIKVKDGAG